MVYLQVSLSYWKEKLSHLRGNKLCNGTLAEQRLEGIIPFLPC